MSRFALVLPLISALAAAAPAHAQLVVTSGFDSGAITVGPQAGAAQASFLSATGGQVMLDFESALPKGVSIKGGSITSDATCEPVFCGTNTTTGGSMFLLSPGFKTTLTFSFDEGIHYFGAYFSGLQLAKSAITFSDGTQQSITLPYASVSQGGLAFVGFQYNSALIKSVSIYTGSDIVAVDDVVYGRGPVAAVSEAGTLGMMALGLLAVAGAARRRLG